MQGMLVQNGDLVISQDSYIGVVQLGVVGDLGRSVISTEDDIRFCLVRLLNLVKMRSNKVFNDHRIEDHLICCTSFHVFDFVCSHALLDIGAKCLHFLIRLESCFVNLGRMKLYHYFGMRCHPKDDMFFTQEACIIDNRFFFLTFKCKRIIQYPFTFYLHI